MALFQKTPTSKQVEESKPLEITPDQVLEMDEAEWYARVYRGDNVPQLTIRAVIMGSMLGFLLAFTNLYIGLKTGWGLGVAITACILSYAVWNIFLNLGIAKTPMTILETNCMQSTASSAGYSTGSVMVSAIPALLMLSVTAQNPKGHHLSWPVLGLWTFFLAALGTLMAIPMKRNLINQERLKFPSGTAAAVTLQSLYSEGNAAIKKARALMFTAVLGTIFPILLDLNIKSRKPLLPSASKLFDWLPGRGSHLVHGQNVAFKPSDWTITFEHNPVMIAAGMIVGLRITFYMVVGGLVLAYGVGPAAYNAIWHAPSGELMRAASTPSRAWKEIGIWLGVPIMVAYGLGSFALQWRTIVRALSGLRRRPTTTDETIKRTEVPFSWFVWGSIFAGLGIVTLAHLTFHIPFYYGVLALFMTFFLSLVAARATGESDVTPLGAMGKITQLTYGALIPQSTTANLMTASITAGAAGSSADLLTDLKSGYLLGANPRRQFMAQFMGIFTGTIATVAGFYLLVPDATALNQKFPAPAAQAWKAVAEVFKHGLTNMHPMHQKAIFWGLALGTIMLILEQVLPKARKWLPSATGLGLGLILPFKYLLAMFLGALIAWVWTRSRKEHAESYLVPVAAGLIAGISIMGVLVAVINNVIL